jgi:predicted unusual protein kinase regulating ubiquinone biosynthesis (AarF/ABC1/UbiB family)
MKGALMKIGQMASYLDDGLPEPVRQALAGLQTQAPPMSAGLAADTIEEALGAPVSQLFAAWDPEPLAAASIGQVHRAVLHDGRPVAVKVQYPGVRDAITADLANANVLFGALAWVFDGFDPEPVVAELRVRLIEELDYRNEARSQTLFARYYAGHPFIHVPSVIDELSSGTVLTSDLVEGADFATLESWSAEERGLAAEAIFRFVFRGIYGIGAFNADPHPGNYLFAPGGRVTFLDFGLVRRFEPTEIRLFQRMVTAMVLRHDPATFRSAVEDAGLLRRGAAVGNDEVVDFFGTFYEYVRRDAPFTMSPDFGSAAVRKTFDRSHPVTQHATVPASFVLIQRINLGLYALLGRLGATRNWRRIAEEIWPWVEGPPSTPMGEDEARWKAMR